MILGVVCSILCEVLYGLSFMFTKQATGGASSFALLAWRFLVALLSMAVLIAVKAMKVSFKGKDPKPLLLVALFDPCIYFTCETLGISMTTASESGVVIACIPVASMVASTLILKKRPSVVQAFGIGLTILGVLVTVLAVGSSSSFNVPGYALLVATVVSYALYSVFVVKATGFTETEVTFAMVVSGAVTFGVIAFVEALGTGAVSALIELPFHDSSFLASVLYLGIGCSVFAFLMSNIAISRIGVNRMASFVGLSTVVSIVAGTLMLGEPFTAMQTVGVCVILIGVYIANLGSRHGRQP